MFVSAFFIPAYVSMTAISINFIAMYYHASRAIPFGSMLAVACICLFVILPLTLVGTILGRNLAGLPDSPCRVNAVPRPIPEKKWYAIQIYRVHHLLHEINIKNTKKITIEGFSWEVLTRLPVFLITEGQSPNTLVRNSFKSSHLIVFSLTF